MLVCFQTLLILFWIFSYCVDLKHFCLERGALYRTLGCSNMFYLFSERDHNNISFHPSAGSQEGCRFWENPKHRPWVLSLTLFTYLECCPEETQLRISQFRFLIKLSGIIWPWIMALCLQMWGESCWKAGRGVAGWQLVFWYWRTDRLWSWSWAVSNLEATPESWGIII
jgi:hypothetical protein